MRENAELLKDDSENDFYEEIESLIKKNPRAWQSVCGVLGLVGGVLAPVFGTLLLAIGWLIGSPEFSLLNVLSMGMFALPIPLLLGGAHCLDLLKRKTSVSVNGQQPEKTLTQALAGYNPQAWRIGGVSKQPAR
jgi:hypothetical protein